MKLMWMKYEFWSSACHNRDSNQYQPGKAIYSSGPEGRDM